MADKSTVLLVEDDPQVREVVTQMLERQGHCVLAAADGWAGLELIAEHEFDFALLDMMLPGPSGFLLAQVLKEQLGGRTFVIMMSGNPSPAHRDYAFVSGVDRFLAKPFSASKLLEVIEGATAVPTARINSNPIAARMSAVPV